MLLGRSSGRRAYARAGRLGGPDAAQLDAFLAQHGSPMTGSGATFIAEGQLYGVDPVFLVAIAGAETSFGQLLYSAERRPVHVQRVQLVLRPHVADQRLHLLGEGIARVAEGLGGPLYHGAGLYSVDAIAPKYCPDGTTAVGHERQGVH